MFCAYDERMFWMKKSNLVRGMFVGVLLFLGVQGPVATASTLQDIQNEQQETQTKLNQLNTQVSAALADVNRINDAVVKLEGDISEKEIEISETEVERDEQEQIVSERLEQAKDRLLSIQKTEMNQTMIAALLEAESMTDFFHRAYVLVTLQEASNEQLDYAVEEQEKLTELETKLTTEKNILIEKNKEVAAQKTELDEKVAALQQTINENQATLAELNKKRQAEETRLAQEQEKAKTKAKAAAETTVATTKAVASVKSKVASATSVKAAAPKEEAEEPAPQASSGRTLTVTATGYSTKQPGLSTHTATGIDLRVNPRVIAVDPRVIPLGSMVEIPGFGIYIAGDTGGAIKGNIIDIHFTTVGQALSWGRRKVTIKVLN